VVVFRFVLLTEPVPLPRYFFQWRLIQGTLAFLHLFPAIAMAALVIPFGILYYDDSFPGFSPRFLELMKAPIITALVASLLYALSMFLFIPLAEEAVTTMRSHGRIFTLSKEKIITYFSQEDWSEALPFITLCNRIWPGEPELKELLANVDSYELFLKDDEETAPPVQTIVPRFSITEATPVTAAEALAMARESLQKNYYYDAHWQASLAERIARPGSTEHSEATQLRLSAWDSIQIIPVQDYEYYHLKRDGYDALLAGEWVKAYYIFNELTQKAIVDPEIDGFFGQVLQELTQSAFFMDEMDWIGGDLFSVSVPTFSLPDTDNGGRFIITMEELSARSGYSFGRQAQIASFDSDNNLVYQVEAPYIKVMPAQVDGKPRIIMVLQALGHHGRDNIWSPVWTPDNLATHITFAIDYDTFLFLAKLSIGSTDNLSLNELFTAARQYGAFGYLSSVFYTEALYRIIESLLFMPAVIFLLVFGWCYRAKHGISIIFFAILLVALPAVFYAILLIYRNILMALAIATVVSLGFWLSALIFMLLFAILFILSLIALVSQHD
jgi:hypothetical protein